jgi:hypothetical protein
MRLLEEATGRPRFDAFLREYFSRYAFQSIDTATFESDLQTRLFDGDRRRADALGLHGWIHEPGLPENAPGAVSDRLERVRTQVEAFARGAPASALRTDGWTTQEWQHFLTSLPQALSAPQMANLDAAFDFTSRRNSEVLFAWLRIAIRHHYRPAMGALEGFLRSQGRRKFLRPLYEDLMASDWGAAEARRIYALARPTYHAVATSTLDDIVR